MYLRLPSMWKKVFYIALAICTTLYVGYKLVTFSGYEDLWQLWCASTYQWLIGGAVLLMPLTIVFETKKWQLLSKNPSFVLALREVFRGLQGALLTPARIGEYPARKFDRFAIIHGFIGGFIQDIVIGVCGIIPLFCLPTIPLTARYILLVVGVGCVVGGILFLGYRVHQRRTPTEYPVGVRLWRTRNVWLWSVAKYLVWVIQWLCVMGFCTGTLPTTMTLVQVLAYLFCVTLTPVPSLMDVPVKGTWAIIIFNDIAPLTATLAVTCLYVINTLVPTLVSLPLITHNS